MTERHAESLPPAVLRVLVVAERRLVQANGGPERSELLLNPAVRHRLWARRGAVGRERLLRERDPQLAVGGRVSLPAGRRAEQTCNDE